MSRRRRKVRRVSRCTSLSAARGGEEGEKEGEGEGGEREEEEEEEAIVAIGCPQSQLPNVQCHSLDPSY